MNNEDQFAFNYKEIDLIGKPKSPLQSLKKDFDSLTIETSKIMLK